MQNCSFWLVLITDWYIGTTDHVVDSDRLDMETPAQKVGFSGGGGSFAQVVRTGHMPDGISRRRLNSLSHFQLCDFRG